MSRQSKDLIEQIKKDRTTYTAQIVSSRKILAKEDPEYLELYHRMFMHVVHKKTALPTKIKEIILSAINAATQYERGIKTHIRGALEAGATKEEILEGLMAASLPAGIHVLTVSLPILEETIKEYNRSKREQ